MISFLHPWALAGLAAAAIPILLHLLARREPPTVVFPAVRYLVTTTREHQRRLKLQNWLLLCLRTLLIVLVVLAAAAPSIPKSGVSGHGPTALVLIVDNSPSSSAVNQGTPVYRQLVGAARQVAARATPQDVLWLITADGIPRRADRAALEELLAGLRVSPRRLDLGSAIQLADEVLAPESRPGEIVLLTDLQASAVSPARPSAPLVIGRPTTPAAPNAGVGSLDAGAQPWSAEGGRVSITLVGDSGSGVPVSVRLGSRPPRQALGHVGGATSVDLAGAPTGWWELSAELDPDELRADDRRVAAIRVAPTLAATTHAILDVDGTLTPVLLQIASQEPGVASGPQSAPIIVKQQPHGSVDDVLCILSRWQQRAGSSGRSPACRGSCSRACRGRGHP